MNLANLFEPYELTWADEDPSVFLLLPENVPTEFVRPQALKALKNVVSDWGLPWSDGRPRYQAGPWFVVDTPDGDYDWILTSDPSQYVDAAILTGPFSGLVAIWE